MEILNFVGLLLIAGTNAWIAWQVKSQKTQPTRDEVFEGYGVQASAIECALKNALQSLPKAPPPTVEVTAKPGTTKLELDYDKLETAIRKAMIKTEIARNNIVIEREGVFAAIPSATVAPQDNGYMINVNGEEIPVRKFPNR